MQRAAQWGHDSGGDFAFEEDKELVDGASVTCIEWGCPPPKRPGATCSVGGCDGGCSSAKPGPPRGCALALCNGWRRIERLHIFLHAACWPAVLWKTAAVVGSWLDQRCHLNIAGLALGPSVFY